MKFLLGLAFKNIIRYKRRTALTFLVLSFGIAFYIIMVSMVEGYKKQSIENYINFDTGHLKVRSVQYDEDAPFSQDNFINNYKTVQDVLKSKKYVTAFTERVKFLGEADNGRDAIPCSVIGIDVGRDEAVFNLTNYVTSGKLSDGAVLIGRGLSEDLGFGKGDLFYLTFKNGQGMMDSIELEIGGIIDSVDPIVNSSTVFMTMSDAKKYLNMDSVSEIAVRTDDPGKAGGYAKDLASSLPGFEVVSWEKLSEGIVAASKADEVTTYIFVVFIMIIALVGIVNTMLMSVYEKTREIGTLKALGMEDRSVLGLFMLEGSIIGILGGIMGVILGTLIVWYLVAVGYDMTAFIGKENENLMASYRLAGVLKGTWHLPSIVISFLLSVLTSIAASYYPAKKATRLQPMECLRTIQ